MRRKIEVGKMYMMKRNSCWWSSMGIPSEELKPGLNAGANIVLLDKVKNLGLPPINGDVNTKF
jgi:hypothetical protein